MTGLLDFERSGVGFLQEDLAPLRYLGERFRAAVLDAYCEGSTRNRELLLEQTRMFDVVRELLGLDWALRNPEAGEIDEAIVKVAGVLASFEQDGAIARRSRGPGRSRLAGRSGPGGGAGHSGCETLGALLGTSAPAERHIRSERLWRRASRSDFDGILEIILIIFNQLNIP